MMSVVKQTIEKEQRRNFFILFIICSIFWSIVLTPSLFLFEVKNKFIFYGSFVMANLIMCVIGFYIIRNNHIQMVRVLWKNNKITLDDKEKTLAIKKLKKIDMDEDILYIFSEKNKITVEMLANL